jgi:serine/threonine protein kinase
MSLDPGLSPHPRYRLLAQIGKGGMGEVFRAQDRLTGQTVALKRVRLPLAPAPAVASPINRRNTSLGEAATVLPSALLAPQTPQFAETVATPVHLEATPAPPAVVIAAEPARAPEQQSLRLHLAQEFRTLAGLRHPNIVSVLDYGFDRNQQPYFTMELLEGGKTLDVAARHQPLEVRVGLLLQILQALTYLHRRGVLHREIGKQDFVGNLSS